jgi:hypothetical protein
LFCFFSSYNCPLSSYIRKNTCTAPDPRPLAVSCGFAAQLLPIVHRRAR